VIRFYTYQSSKKMAWVRIVIVLVFSSLTVAAQQISVEAIQFRNGVHRAIIQPSLVTGSQTFQLPASGGTLLSTTTGWLRGGQDLLPGGPTTLGSTDAADVTLITNNVERMTIEGSAGATQGFIGINETTPLYRLHVVHSLNAPTAGFNLAQRIQSTLSAGPIDANAIVSSLYSTLDISSSSNLGGGIFHTAVGGLVTVNYTAGAGRLADMAGVAGSVRVDNGGAPMPQMRNADGVFGNLTAASGAFIEQASGLRAEIVGTSATINRGAGIYVTAPTFSGSTLQSFAGIRIDDVSSLAGQVTGSGPHAFRYNGPDDVVIDANGFVGIGMLAPDVSLDVDGGFVMRNDGAFDIDALGTAVTVGNRSFVIIRNPNGGAQPNNTVVTLGDGVRNGHVLIVRQSGGENIIINATGNVASNANRTYNNNDVGMYIWHNNVWSEISFSNNP
jgi:hypothetical protein